MKRKAKEMGINLSAEFRNFLEYRLNALAEDAGGIDLLVKKKQLAKLKGKMDVILAEKLVIEQQVRVAEEQIEENTQKDLIKEKQRIESLTKCLNCNNQINPALKSHKFCKGILCNSCYMTGNSADIKKWNNG